MKHIVYTLSIFLLTAFSVGAQQTPALPQSEAITIKGATAHIGDGTVIENSTLVFENGIITAIGSGAIPSKGKLIDATGKHVYPGFIIANNTLGLVEIDAVRASVDVSEIGGMTPHVRSLIAYNAESKVVESMRPNGVLIGQIAPRGGRIPGTSSIVQFDAWNWEDAVIKVDDAIHLNWPSSFTRGRWWAGEDPGIQPNKAYDGDLEKLESFFKNAIAYGKAKPKKKNLVMEAMQGLFSGDQKLYISADGEKEIIDAVTFAKAMGVTEVVLVGGYHAYKITDFLKQHQIPVLVGRPHSTPNHEDDDYDLPYKLAKLLHDAGLLVALENSGRFERFQSRNLPFYAGQVAAQGLGKEEALKLITLNPAKILGIDNDYGTLTTGKSATLFISEGDALDMRTNKLTHVFIDGRAISLDTHQTELYERYMGKYESEGK